MSQVLIRYGELGLKSHKVRRRFENKLIDNIAGNLDRENLQWLIRREPGRIFLNTMEGETGKVIFLLKHIPGIVSVSSVTEFEITNGLDTIGKEAVKFSRKYLEKGMTFGVRARRTGDHKFSSQEAAAYAGEKILDAISGLKVNLSNPDRKIHMEIRQKKGYFYTETEKGIGGLPMGTQGQVMLLLSGKNSAAAGFLMMKRGCKIYPVHMNAECKKDSKKKDINTDGKLKEETEVQKAFDLLKAMDHKLKLRKVDSECSKKNILELFEQTKSHAVVIGSGYENFINFPQIPGMTIFHPLLGMERKEIENVIDFMEELKTELGKNTHA